MKIMAIVDSPWIAALGQHACDQADFVMVGQLCLDFYMIEGRSEIATRPSAIISKKPKAI
jgi:hypothetical protein